MLSPSDIPFITAISILRYAIFPAGLIFLRAVNALLVKLLNISNLFKKFFIHPSKDFLLQQINLRMNKMFKQGVKQEVKEFLKLKIRSDLSANKVIGIQEIKDHLVEKLTLPEVKNLIQIRTRQYAKRQFTWARGKMSSWKLINPKNYKDILDTLVN